jgi:hypothetical protein
MPFWVGSSAFMVSSTVLLFLALPT